MSHPLFEQHRETLERAVAAIGARTFFSAYPEVPSGKIYGEDAKARGQAAFDAVRKGVYDLDQPTAGGDPLVTEASPYGLELGIGYPRPDVDGLVAAAGAAGKAWAAADRETRAGICLEVLHRLNRRSFEMAFAVMHTTGQGFMMSFQAGGPHAQDRGLEAVAYAWEELGRVPERVTWSKRVGRDETVHLEKRFRTIPRGIGLVVACSTFPTWNSYPAIFADLMTGNAVIVKPHPGAVLPLAITVRVIRDVLAENGFSPDLVTLAVDEPDAPIAAALATRPEIGIVDYTGGPAFEAWLREHCSDKPVFTEGAGVNTVVLDSLDDLRAVTGNLAFSLSLYSGQMCTTSQDVFIPSGGVRVGDETKSFDEIAGAIVKAVDWLLGEPARGAEILGAIQSEATAARVDAALADAKAAGLQVLREPTPVENERFPEARVRSPLIVRTTADDRERITREAFGPIVYLVETADTDESIALATGIAKAHGALTCSLYSTDDAVIERMEDAAAGAGVALSVNLTGGIYVNQSAAFSDFHVSGANPAGNATLCDAAFVASRFRVAQRRIPVAAAAEGAGAERAAAGAAGG